MYEDYKTKTNDGNFTHSKGNFYDIIVLCNKDNYLSDYVVRGA